MAETPGYDDTIIQAVITALEGISSDSGYNYSLIDVREFDRQDTDQGLRPSARVFWINEQLNQAHTEWDTELRLSIEARIDRDPYGGLASGKKTRLIKRDVVKALSAMDFTTLNVLLRTIEAVPFIEEDKDETIDGVTFTVVFGYTVDFLDPAIALAPSTG